MNVYETNSLICQDLPEVELKTKVPASENTRSTTSAIRKRKFWNFCWVSFIAFFWTVSSMWSDLPCVETILKIWTNLRDIESVQIIERQYFLAWKRNRSSLAAEDARHWKWKIPCFQIQDFFKIFGQMGMSYDSFLIKIGR